MPPCDQPPPRCALAIAHPGHEVRVFGWMEANRPLVSVLTDGSGRRGTPRIASTEQLVGQTGSRCDSLFGKVSDRELYAAVLAGDAGLFLRLADHLARVWEANEIEQVAGDASEGAIMAHDLWRGVINRAVALAESRTGRTIVNRSFCLEHDPRFAPGGEKQVAQRQILDNGALQRKLLAAGNYRGLEQEVERAVSAWGRDALRHELLLDPAVQASDPAGERFQYERHGEEQVRAGIYQKVVRYREHLLPILARLQEGSFAA